MTGAFMLLLLLAASTVTATSEPTSAGNGVTTVVPATGSIVQIVTQRESENAAATATGDE